MGTQRSSSAFWSSLSSWERYKQQQKYAENFGSGVLLESQSSGVRPDLSSTQIHGWVLLI